MEARIDKKIEVIIDLNNEERELMFKTSKLLDKIEKVLLRNELQDDDHFIILFKDEKGDYCSTVTKQAYDLYELNCKFADFLW